MSTSASTQEFRKLTDFQKNIYLDVVDEETGDKLDPETGKQCKLTRTTPFYREYQLCAWYSMVPARMPGVEDGDDIVYVPNNTFHFLTFSDLRSFFPPLRVKASHKDKVQICWTHNIGTGVIDRAELRMNDKVFHSFDHVWCDDFFQFNMKPGFRRSHFLAVGSIKQLEEWSTHLPAYTTNVQLPWWYSDDPALALPLHYCCHPSNIKVEHRFRFKRRISELLRMRIYKNGAWVEIKPNFAYLEGARAETKIPTPELWGRYCYIHSNELEWHAKEGNLSFYVKNVLSADSPNPYDYNSCADIELRCDNPCLAIFWQAENYESSKNRILSNYTTNTGDLYSGYDPVLSTSMSYNGVPRLQDMPSDHFSIAEPRKFFLSPPCETGYHAYAFGVQPFGFDPDVGVVLSVHKAVLSVKIADTDIYKIAPQTEDSIEDVDVFEEGVSVLSQAPNTPAIVTPKFIPRVRLLVLRKYTITFNDKGLASFDII